MDNKKKDLKTATNTAETDLYTEAQRAIIEKEWDEIFKNLKVGEEEYKIFLSMGSKNDDTLGPRMRPSYPKK